MFILDKGQDFKDTYYYYPGKKKINRKKISHAETPPVEENRDGNGNETAEQYGGKKTHGRFGLRQKFYKDHFISERLAST